MARILVVEANPDVRALLELVVRRVGHEPVSDEQATESVDAAVIEPADDTGLLTAKRLASHAIPVVFVSIFPPDLGSLDLAPAAYLVKPFSLYALEVALAKALTAA